MASAMRWVVGASAPLIERFSATKPGLESRATHVNDDRRDPWNEYRRNRRLFLYSWLGFVPGVFVIGLVLTRLFRSELPSYVVAFSWLSIGAIAWLRMTVFSCPGCGRPFFYTSWHFHNPFATHCVHCGLRKWSNPAEQNTPTPGT